MAAQVLPNSHITIYNKYVDPATRSEKYKRSVVKNVVWQSQKAIASGKEKINTNTALILIPFALGTEYVLPKTWQADSDHTGWTLQEGDVIARGVITQEISALYTMSALRAVYEDVVTIISIDAMDQGSPNMQHWELGCK